ncbi:MAG: DUF3836 domain-containing protein [Bacteroidales bacterium]
MKALSIKSFLFSLILVMNYTFVSAQGENNFIYDTKYENQQIISKTVFEKNEDTNGLNPKTKYEYKYDDQHRIVEKSAFRWNEQKREWINNFQMLCTYNENGTVMVKFAQWDKKKDSFSLNPQTHTYSIEEAQQMLAKK